MSVTRAIYEWGSWRFEPAEYRLTRDSTLVPLPAKTLDLLELLVTRAPNLVTKEEILANVWAEAAVEEGNIAFHVAALRKVLDAGGDQSCIETVRGRGYRFVAPIVGRSPGPPQPSAAAVAVTAPPPAPRRHLGRRTIIAAGLVVVVTLGLVSVLRRREAEWSVAVLPFEVLDAGDSDFVPGLATYITLHLELTGIRVLPLAVPAGERPLDADAHLGAEARLAGTLKRSGNGWRVSVRLIRTSDAVQTWNWTFDVSPDENRPPAGPDDERSRLQEMMAQRIAQGLERHLSASPR